MTDSTKANPDGQAAPEGSGDSGNKEVEGLKTAVKAEREKRQGLERELAELRGTVSALTSKSSGDGGGVPKSYTRKQLDAAVADGQVSADDAERIWEDQQERKQDAKL